MCRAGLSYYDLSGSYFLGREYSRVADEDDTVFCERRLREAGVAGVAGSVFYPQVSRNPRRMRFTFSKSRATIEAAACRLEGFKAARN